MILSEPCKKCGRNYKPSDRNDFTCPRCGYMPPEFKLLQTIFGKKR